MLIANKPAASRYNDSFFLQWRTYRTLATIDLYHRIKGDPKQCQPNGEVWSGTLSTDLATVPFRLKLVSVANYVFNLIAGRQPRDEL